MELHPLFGEYDLIAIEAPISISWQVVVDKVDHYLGSSIPRLTGIKF